VIKVIDTVVKYHRSAARSSWVRWPDIVCGAAVELLTTYKFTGAYKVTMIRVGLAVLAILAWPNGSGQSQTPTTSPVDSVTA
jgi:hypothetical protein